MKIRSASKWIGLLAAFVVREMLLLFLPCSLRLLKASSLGSRAPTWQPFADCIPSRTEPGKFGGHAAVLYLYDGRVFFMFSFLLRLEYSDKEVFRVPIPFSVRCFTDLVERL